MHMPFSCDVLMKSKSGIQNWDRLNSFIDTKKAFKNYTCFTLRQFRLFSIHLHSSVKKQMD